MSDKKKSIWPMTDVQIAEISERCDKATEGPWVIDLPDWGECNGISSKNGTQILNAGSCIPDPKTAVDHGGTVHDWKEEIYDYGVHKWADAVFIAHAREDVPALLAEVARLQKVARLIGLHREAENQELLAEVERLKAENKRLEKAANWLANMLEYHVDGCCPLRFAIESGENIPKIDGCKGTYLGEDTNDPFECRYDENVRVSGLNCWVEAAMKATSEGKE